MRREQREMLADWLMMIGGLALLVSLFLVWSHQFSPAFLVVWGGALHGVPRDPTAWQVYSTADVLLGLMAGALVAVALAGARGARMATTVAAAGALAFTVHALSVPPTNGVNIFDPARSVPGYVPTGASAGVGETVAIVALTLALVGLVLSFSAD